MNQHCGEQAKRNLCCGKEAQSPGPQTERPRPALRWPVSGVSGRTRTCHRGGWALVICPCHKLLQRPTVRMGRWGHSDEQGPALPGHRSPEPGDEAAGRWVDVTVSPRESSQLPAPGTQLRLRQGGGESAGGALGPGLLGGTPQGPAGWQAGHGVQMSCADGSRQAGATLSARRRPSAPPPGAPVLGSPAPARSLARSPLPYAFPPPGPCSACSPACPSSTPSPGDPSRAGWAPQPGTALAHFNRGASLPHPLGPALLSTAVPTRTHGGAPRVGPVSSLTQGPGAQQVPQKPMKPGGRETSAMEGGTSPLPETGSASGQSTQGDTAARNERK